MCTSGATCLPIVYAFKPRFFSNSDKLFSKKQEVKLWYSSDMANISMATKTEHTLHIIDIIYEMYFHKCNCIKYKIYFL